MSKDGIIYRSWQVFKLNYPVGLSVVLTFTIQYTFFPGVMLIKKLDFFGSFAWFANSIITFHNLCDTLGRTLAGKYIFVNKRIFPLVCCIRYKISYLHSDIGLYLLLLMFYFMKE